MKILLAGGGTGGHIMPILAVVRQLKRVEPKTKFLWLGMKNGPEAKIAQDNFINFKPIFAGKLRRYFSLRNITDFVKLPIGVVQAYLAVKKFKPDVCFSKGGYVSVPAVIACSRLNVPVILHESDVVAGRANLFMAKYATKIALGFEEGKQSFKNYEDKIVVIGNPVREEVLVASREKGMLDFKLNKNKPVLLVMGGSQGARKINELILNSLDKLLQKWQIIHLLGPSLGSQVLGSSGALAKDYHAFKFLNGNKMGEAYACADLVVSRAGANSLAEIAALGKAAILIPYPYASANHQKLNAEIYVKKGAAIILDEKDLTSERLLVEINKLADDKNKLESLKMAMLKMSDKNAAEKLTVEILDLAKNKKNAIKKYPKVLIFTEGTILMQKNGEGKSREERVKQVKNDEISVKDFANYVSIGKAVEKLKSWQEQGAKISYLTSRTDLNEVEQIKNVLVKYDFLEGDLIYRKENQNYKNIIEAVKPDVLIEDDCESIGGQEEMVSTFVNSEIKKRMKIIVVKEFEGIDGVQI